MMTDVITRVDESIYIDAMPHAVYTYCLDPRRLFAGDPKAVVESDVKNDGVGTTFSLKMASGPIEEDDVLEYVDVVPDKRIEIAMQPTMHVLRRHGAGHVTAPYSLVHVFEREGGGTQMTLKVQVHHPPLYERMMDRLEGKGPERMVQARLERVKHAVEGMTAAA
ncbi:SRPBCC domain-containing protein [Demequina sp. NBRC 110054]|uniref:SRPBCC family protein n=1 Tax=Demequina sp. NBRC 110054 TaxID=1570343 RepID=UPI0009FBFB2A|nr:SRPBCC family protein [Demequina sp. NBRC 110054]